MEENLEKINGNEIIKFLNELSFDDDENLCDVSIVEGSFVFESQVIKDEKYTLKFTGDYNNWGTHQSIYDNHLHITKNTAWFSLTEPFDGDGTDEALEGVLKPWLEAHEFESSPNIKFSGMIRFAQEQLCLVTFKDKELLQKIIDELIDAKTYMK